MESLWHVLDYREDPGELMRALAPSGWLDRHAEHRYVVHGWAEHCEDAVNMRLARTRQFFADGQAPKLVRLGGKERETAEMFYKSCAQTGDPCAPPRPSPSPGLSQNPAFTPPGDSAARQGSLTDHEPAPRENNEPPFSKMADDDETRERYASAEDELKAIFQEKAGARITIAVLDSIRGNLADRGVSVERFVEEVRRHKVSNWKNPSGFLRNLSKTFRMKTASAGPAVTAAKAAVRDYQCPHCGSRTQGQGAVLIDGKPVPCRCASPEYVQKLIERGVFLPNETTPRTPVDPKSNMTG
jgi:hypothetical protein